MKRSLLPVFVLIVWAIGSSLFCTADQPDGGHAQRRKVADLVYKTVGTESLKLDLYLPGPISTPLPLIVWIHGGGWRAGDKSDVPILPLASDGFNIASINYRLTGEAPFPAQIEDVKAALRWLRVHAGEYGIDPNRIGVIGHSAGGHLAALAGLTGHDSVFDMGENLNVSSAVQAVCDMSGPSDIVTMFDGASAWRQNALTALLGGGLPEKLKLAQAASPVTYVRPDAPPFLIIHGANDQLVPLQQATELSHKLEEAGAKPQVIILPQTDHDIFVHKQQFVSQVTQFFITTLGRK